MATFGGFSIFCSLHPRLNLAMIAKIYVPSPSLNTTRRVGQKAVIFRDRNQISLAGWVAGRWRCVTRRTLSPGKEIITSETQRIHWLHTPGLEEKLVQRNCWIFYNFQTDLAKLHCHCLRSVIINRDQSCQSRRIIGVRVNYLDYRWVHYTWIRRKRNLKNGQFGAIENLSTRGAYNYFGLIWDTSD